MAAASDWGNVLADSAELERILRSLEDGIERIRRLLKRLVDSIVDGTRGQPAPPGRHAGHVSRAKVVKNPDGTYTVYLDDDPALTLTPVLGATLVALLEQARRGAVSAEEIDARVAEILGRPRCKANAVATRVSRLRFELVTLRQDGRRLIVRQPGELAWGFVLGPSAVVQLPSPGPPPR